jgi:predicted nucleic acid-binding protein
MVILIDTSVWLAAYRDRSGRLAEQVRAARGDTDEVFSRFVAMEILQGSTSETDWARFEAYLQGQNYVEFGDSDWLDAARIYYDARCVGITVGSTIDCCIAQTALANDLLLIHDDSDYERIAKIRSLRHLRLRLRQP